MPPLAGMPPSIALWMHGSGESSVIADLVDRGGLFHCTSVRALRLILRAGHLHPARVTGASARGAAVASRVRRIGGISLFDLLPNGAVTNPALPWFRRWLAFHPPVTVALHIDRTRLLAAGGRLLSEAETRPLAAGLMIRGEVCHVGSLPLTCVNGYLFARRRPDAGLVGRYLPGSTLSVMAVRNVLSQLRRASCPGPP